MRIDPNRFYSEKRIEDSNLIVMISNQSFENPNVKIKGYIDDELLFEVIYSVGGQHVVTYYYSNLKKGNHTIFVESEDGAKLTEIIEIGEEKLWIYITYWGGKDFDPEFGIMKQDKPIGLE